MSETPAPSILLLAGEVRDAWSAALSRAGFDVRTTGWLDGLTAARLRRPDLVLVSADLPPNAPQIVCTGIRSAADLKAVPIAVVGLPPDVAEREWELPLRADRYVPAPADPGALVHEVREALRIGRVPWKRRPIELAVIALLVLGVAILIVRNVADEVLGRHGRGPGLPGLASVVLVSLAIAVLVAAIALGVAARPRRPITLRERRAALGWLGFLLVQLQNLVGHGSPVLKLGAGSLGLLAWAGWAWLGPRVKPRTPAAMRWFRLLTALLALLAAAPWLAWAWWVAS